MHDAPHWYIHEITTALPRQSLSSEESAERMQVAYAEPRVAKRVRRMMRLAGVERRYLAALDHQTRAEPLFQPAAAQPHGPGMGARSAAFDASAGELVVRAASALEAGALERVRALITVSCTHAASPGLEYPLLTQTALRPAVQRWHLGFMGCSAGLAALRLVHGLREAAPALAVTCELSSLHFQYSDDPEQMTANMLFADGVAAVLCAQQPGRVRLRGAESIALLNEADQMRWWADDHGLRLSLAPALPETLRKHLPGAVDAFLDRCGVSRREIDHWLVHPGGPQILSAAADSLGLADGALAVSHDVLRQHGNMSSSTILFILREFMASDARGLGVAAAFGPGLTVELALVEFEG